MYVYGTFVANGTGGLVPYTTFSACMGLFSILSFSIRLTPSIPSHTRSSCYRFFSTLCTSIYTNYLAGDLIGLWRFNRRYMYIWMSRSGYLKYQSIPFAFQYLHPFRYCRRKVQSDIIRNIRRKSLRLHRAGSGNMH